MFHWFQLTSNHQPILLPLAPKRQSVQYLWLMGSCQINAPSSLNILHLPGAWPTAWYYWSTKFEMYLVGVSIHELSMLCFAIFHQWCVCGWWSSFTPVSFLDTWYIIMKDKNICIWIWMSFYFYLIWMLIKHSKQIKKELHSNANTNIVVPYHTKLDNDVNKLLIKTVNHMIQFKSTENNVFEYCIQPSIADDPTSHAEFLEKKLMGWCKRNLILMSQH